MNTIDSKEKIIAKGNIPSHIAIIMDGNGRWAKNKSLPRLAGHREGINSVRKITRICGELHVSHLTLYTFSTENWKRPKKEVSALMSLLLKTIKDEIKRLHKNNVKLTTIGDLNILPESAKKGIENGVNLTKENTGLNLILGLNYGSRQEIVRAVKKISKQVTLGDIKLDQINENTISDNLFTSNIKDPDLVIRTGGEKRISNFLLWQAAYSELYLTDTFWPDFREKQLFEAIIDYQKRERRFGMIKTKEKFL